MVKEKLIESVVTLLVIPLIGVLGTYLTLILNTFFKKLSASTKDEKLKNAIDEVSKITKKAVSVVQQDFVKELKKGGKFSEKEKIEAFNRAKNIVLSKTPEDVISQITKRYGDYEDWVNNEIEDVVYENSKKSTKG